MADLRVSTVSPPAFVYMRDVSIRSRIERRLPYSRNSIAILYSRDSLPSLRTWKHQSPMRKRKKGKLHGLRSYLPQVDLGIMPYVVFLRLKGVLLSSGFFCSITQILLWKTLSGLSVGQFRCGKPRHWCSRYASGFWRMNSLTKNTVWTSQQLLSAGLANGESCSPSNISATSYSRYWMSTIFIH